MELVAGRPFELGGSGLFGISGVSHATKSIGADIAELLDGGIEGQGPDAHLADDLLQIAHLRAGVGIESIEGGAALEKAFRPVTVSASHGDGIDRAAQGIAPEEDAPLALNKFDPVQAIRIDGVGVLGRSTAEGAVIEAHAVDEEEILSPGEASDEGGALSVGGLLDGDSGCERKGLGEGSKGFVSELLRSDDLA